MHKESLVFLLESSRLFPGLFVFIGKYYLLSVKMMEIILK